MCLHVKHGSFVQRLHLAAAGRPPLLREAADTRFVVSDFIARTSADVPQDVLDALDTLDTYFDTVV